MTPTMIMMPVSHRFSIASTLSSVAPIVTDESDVSSLLRAVPTYRQCKTCLPETFRPHPYSVVLGRGKVNDHIGNNRLKVMVEWEVDNYVRAKSRREKSFVVARVLETIQDACNGEGAFVRNDQGRWYEVDDSTAREKISTLFRNRLSDQYKSSTSNKTERRRQRKALQRLSGSSSQSGCIQFSSTQDMIMQPDTSNTSMFTGPNEWSDCSSENSFGI